MNSFNLSIFHTLTLSGTVNSNATYNGTPTSSNLICGSGLITLLAEKFTLFPAKLCLNLPSLLLILSANVFNGSPPRCLAGGTEARSLLKKVVT